MAVSIGTRQLFRGLPQFFKHASHPFRTGIIVAGKLILRLKPEVHKKYRLLASSKKVSLNKLLNDTLEQAV